MWRAGRDPTLTARGGQCVQLWHHKDGTFNMRFLLSPRKVRLDVYTPVALSRSSSSIESSTGCCGCKALSKVLSSSRSNSPFPSPSCSVHHRSSLATCSASRFSFFWLRLICLAAATADLLTTIWPPGCDQPEVATNRSPAASAALVTDPDIMFVYRRVSGRLG